MPVELNVALRQLVPGSLRLAVCVLTIASGTVANAAEIYRKSTETKDVVLGKLYNKKGRFEISAPDAGLILNQAYINTILIHGGLNYYFSEEWGFGVDGAYAINSDKSERECIETFYNNPRQVPHAECLSQDSEGTPPAGGNLGPAYVPIRETNFIIGGNAIWSPVYGKQLLFLSAVIHFDLFMTFGGGVNLADFYDKQQVLRNGKKSRGAVQDGQSATEAGLGCELNESNCYGLEGRPDPLSSTTFFASASIGQRFNFSNNIFLKLEFKDYLLLGTESGFDNLFAFWGGLGFRF